MFAVCKLKTVKIAILLITTLSLLLIPVGNEKLATVYFGSALREIPVYRVDTEENKIAISFDAAWGADKTEKIMEILKSYNAQATFFLVGFWVEKYPEITKKIAENGFEIGTHSNTHPDMAKLDKKTIEKELKTSIEIIESTTNTKVKVFRPPYGSYNDTLINTAKELGLTTIQWDVDSLDWKGIYASEIHSRICNKVKKGSIILCHNNSDYIVDALPGVLSELINKGYEFVRVSDLIYSDNYTIDHTGTQKRNNV